MPVKVVGVPYVLKKISCNENVRWIEGGIAILVKKYSPTVSKNFVVGFPFSTSQNLSLPGKAIDEKKSGTTTKRKVDSTEARKTSYERKSL